MREVLVILSADPRRSDRALEALRMCVGLALAENRVRLRLEEGARAVAEPAKHAFPGWAVAAEHLAAFRQLGGEVESDADVLEDVERARVVIRWTT